MGPGNTDRYAVGYIPPEPARAGSPFADVLASVRERRRQEVQDYLSGLLEDDSLGTRETAALAVVIDLLRRLR